MSMDLDFELNADRLREECGVFGIYGHTDAAALTALGLHALQHRGQEAAGIVSFDGERFQTERRLGLVGDHFSSEKVINRLQGSSALGHVRYSTTGETILRNVQPLFAELAAGGFAVAHNGNLTNGLTLRRELIAQGAICQSTSDTEVILHLVARSQKTRMVERYIDALRALEGAYALVALTNKKLIGARDPNGIRPLILGELNGAHILCSETCALDIIGAKYIREVENGEVVVISDDGIESLRPFPKQPARPCIFEYIYFSRPDSMLGGRSIYEVRKAMGRELARESAIDADVIVPIPDSGVPAALGYAQETGIPFELGIIRNHYVGRTFIEPTQTIRSLGVKLKHNANRAVVKDKRVVLIDDQIVVVEKPAGMPSVPARTPLDPPDVARVLRTLPEFAGEEGGLLEAAHRLDRDTSGLLVLARSRAARGALGLAFERRQVRKRYLAVVQGRLVYQDGSKTDKVVQFKPATAD